MKSVEQLKFEMAREPKKWLVTGVAGFIGSNILEELLKLDQVVVGLDNFLTGYEHNLDDVKRMAGEKRWDGFTFIKGDVRNLDDCRRACRGVDYILHQAALGSVPRSIDDPILTNQSNVDGFLNMLVAAKEARVKRFVFASSSSVYGDSARMPKVEDTIGAPLSPYAASKLINEIYAGVFSRVYEFEWVGLRYFNVFGKRQDPQGAYAAVIPRWVDALMNLETPVINGDGETSRDFCYIKDVVQANILAALSGSGKPANRTYNVAYGDRTTLNQLFRLIRKHLSRHIPEVERIEPEYGPFRKGDVRHSLADISMAGELLGYSPTYKVEKGIGETIEWYVDAGRGQRSISPP
ncbi:MAG: SDR family oxidoreductase [Syntrophobacteraceae bacterium]